MTDQQKRISKTELYISIARLIAQRSTCLRRQVGAILVKDDVILTTGFNGTPKGVPHCEDIGCYRMIHNIPSGERHEMCRGVHAEQNCIIFAAREDVSVVGSTLYCTTFPCIICAKMLINAGIKSIIFEGSYGGDEVIDIVNMFRSAEISVFKYTNQGMETILC